MKWRHQTVCVVSNCKSIYPPKRHRDNRFCPWCTYATWTVSAKCIKTSNNNNNNHRQSAIYANDFKIPMATTTIDGRVWRDPRSMANDPAQIEETLRTYDDKVYKEMQKHEKEVNANMCIQFVWSGSALRITLSNRCCFICSFSLAASLAAIRGSHCHFSRFATGSEELRNTSNASVPRVCVSARMCEWVVWPYTQFCGRAARPAVRSQAVRLLMVRAHARDSMICVPFNRVWCSCSPLQVLVLRTRERETQMPRCTGKENKTKKYIYTITCQLNMHVAFISHNEYSVCMAFRLSSIEKNTHSMFAFVFSLFGLVGADYTDGIRSVRSIYTFTFGCRLSVVGAARSECRDFGKLC